MKHKGFSFIEVIAPCTTLYQRRNKLGDGLDAMEYYKEDADIQHGVDTRAVDIGFQGKYRHGQVRRAAEADLSSTRSTSHYTKVIGDSYQLYGKTPLEKEAEEKARLSATKEAKIRECGAND